MGKLFVTYNIPEAVFLGNRFLVMSPLPATVKKEIKTYFKRQRGINIREDGRFVDMVEDLREYLEE